MWDRIERLTEPAVEPLTLAEVKQQCRVDTSDDDAFLQRAIKSAREVIEGPHGAGIVMIASQWQMRLDWLTPEIWIPTGPVISIDPWLMSTRRALFRRLRRSVTSGAKDRLKRGSARRTD